MKGFLVLARCVGCDIPMALYSEFGMATETAKSLTLPDVQKVASDTFRATVRSVFKIEVLEMGGIRPPHVVFSLDFEER